MNNCDSRNDLVDTPNNRLPESHSFVETNSCGEWSLEVEQFNDLLSQHLPASVCSWTCDNDGWRFELEHASILVINNDIESLHVLASSETMHRTHLDGMRRQLRCILRGMTETDLTPTGFAVKLIELCEEASAWERTWREELKVRSNRQRSSDTENSKQEGWDASKVEDWESILDNPAGVNLASVKDTAIDILGKPLSEICSRIKEDLRILHIEPVYRGDLMERFLRKQTRIHQALLRMPYNALRQSVASKDVARGSRDDNVEGLARELARQRVTFHGAPHQVLQSIVRYGFTIPGEEIGDTGEELAVRCGSTYGRGIYSSPDPMFASAYYYRDGSQNRMIRNPADVPGLRIVICATVMGRPMIRERNQRHKGDLLSEHAHSHVSSNQLEYVVYDSAQIVPVYVLHLDYGAEEARKEFDRIAADPDAYFWRRRFAIKVDRVTTEEPTCPGDVQRKEQALKAAAAKWFPYGYGPAQGTSFVIEDIADVSDDEEEYGDLQELRIEEADDKPAQAREQGISWFDEFQTVRKTSHGVKMYNS